jgi:hypothetical protein
MTDQTITALVTDPELIARMARARADAEPFRGHCDCGACTTLGEARECRERFEAWLAL